MNQATPFAPKTRPRDLGDDALLDLVQRQTFRYFWDFAHPVSGLPRERSNVRLRSHAEAIPSQKKWSQPNSRKG